MNNYINILSFTIIVFFILQSCEYSTQPEEIYYQMSTSNDSSLSDSVKTLYIYDAVMLANFEMSKDSVLKYTVLVPDSLIMKYYNTLILVNNASKIKHVDYVRGIHPYSSKRIKKFFIYINDTSSMWITNWQNGNLWHDGNLNTGIIEVDNIFKEYRFNITSMTRIFDFYSIEIETEDYVNKNAFISLFSNIEEISISGKGFNQINTIDALPVGNSIIITYSIGWGDCPAGCIYRHYWMFEIEKNLVILLKEYGDKLP